MSGSNAVIAERGIMPPFLYRCPNAGGNIQAWMADNADHDDLTYVRLTCLHDRAAVLCAFDLIELNSKDLRKQPIEARKHALANLLYRVRDGIVFNRHYGGDGAIIYRQACALGCEGIVSKRRGSPYRSGRTDHWLPVIRRQSLGEFIGKTLAGAASASRATRMRSTALAGSGVIIV